MLIYGKLRLLSSNKGALKHDRIKHTSLHTTKISKGHKINSHTVSKKIMKLFVSI